MLLSTISDECLSVPILGLVILLSSRRTGIKWLFSRKDRVVKVPWIHIDTSISYRSNAALKSFNLSRIEFTTQHRLQLFVPNVRVYQGPHLSARCSFTDKLKTGRDRKQHSDRRPHTPQIQSFHPEFHPASFHLLSRNL